MKPAVILIFALSLFLLVAGFLYNYPKGSETKFIKINEAEFLVQIADEAHEHKRGLSGRDSLGENEGMLFVFEKPDFYSFWMKDVKFPIDIVWIDGNLKVIGVEPELSPQSFPKTFAPPQPVRYVLEIKSGAAGEKNIKIGDMINL
ncbi:MAG: DUF192 domain-containing protein [Patescibacteria group bacterium]